jgi:nucleotide sugar dehydrogenase
MPKVCIVGLGFVGKHLVESFYESGKFEVLGYDINEKTINEMKSMTGYEKCFFTNDENELKDCDLFCISVPTLLNESRDDINEGPIESVRKMLLRVAKKGSTVVIESSVYVGATRKLFGCLLEFDINVGFSPERVDPGRIEPRHVDIPKVISGLDDQSREIISRYYSKVFKNTVSVSSTECAEMCKLYENCFRLVNIAYVNEISDLCNMYNIDSYEMINASATKPFGFMAFNPGLGIGGHCIPVNPYYLARGNFEKLPVLYKSLTTMEKRPIEKAKELVNEYFGDRVLVIGAAFKPGEKLLTNSPSIEFIKSLEKYGKEVMIYDPLVNNGGSMLNWLNPLNLFKKSMTTYLSEDNFNVNYIDNNYDIVVVAMNQKMVDWEVINQLDKRDKTILWFVDKEKVLSKPSA